MNIKNVSMGIDVVSPDKLSENGFNIAIDLRYDHSISYNPDNPTIAKLAISLVVEKEGRPTKYEVTIREVA
jgi:hypothetical protein